MGWFEEHDPSQHPIRQRVQALDAAWAKRFLAGGAEEKRQMSALNQLIAGVMA